MLYGAILYPEVPDEPFTSSLHAIRRVKWEAVVPTAGNSVVGNSDELFPAHCNLVAILDREYTSYAFLSTLVRRGCHLFLPEKQKMTSAERMKLVQLAEEGNTFIQIRNDLLFHPSFLAGEKSEIKSKLIEIHHIAPERLCALQEMLYSNLLMILRIADSDPSRISVCSIPNTEYQPDVVNLHLNFNNGSAASLTLSFKGEKNEHLLTVHSASGTLHYNFKENDLNTHDSELENAILYSDDLLIKQIDFFSNCILKKGCSRFGMNDEARTYRLLEKINQKLEFSSVPI